MEKSSYNKGIGSAEHNKILDMLSKALYDDGDAPYDTVREFIEEFDLVDDSEPTGNRDHSNDYYDEVEYVFKITEDLGISFWWVECIPHDIDIVENWIFKETLVKLVKPVKVERIEWQPVITD